MLLWRVDMNLTRKNITIRHESGYDLLRSGILDNSLISIPLIAITHVLPDLGPGLYLYGVFRFGADCAI